MDLKLASEAGPAALARMADEATNKIAAKLVANRRGVWKWDPEHADVLGLTEPGVVAEAWIVIYLADDDFEVSESFEMLG